MNYSYIGNTSAKEAKLLMNIEAHLILLNKLFKSASPSDSWVSNSPLQIRYAEIIKESNLLNSREMNLIAKNARTKVSFLKDLRLVDFEELKITSLGQELLSLIENKRFEETNTFLQVDLVSLFFLKNFFKYKKASDIDDLFLKYLYVFKKFNGKLDRERFRLLPIVGNYENVDDFIEILNDQNIDLGSIFNSFVYCDAKLKERREGFLNNFRNGIYDDLSFFATAKGTDFIGFVPFVIRLFLDIKNKTYSKSDFRKLFKNEINGEKNYFKYLYLPTMLGTRKVSINKKNYTNLYKKILNNLRGKSDEEVANYFFDLIYISRYENNLNDYYDQNRYYLGLTGVFTFESDHVYLSKIFNMLLQTQNYIGVLKEISDCKIEINSLDYMFEAPEIKESFRQNGVKSSYDLNRLQYEENKSKLNKLLTDKFKRHSVMEILSLFKTRDDDKIQKSVSTNATVPTIFEYITAIAWYYIDNNNIDAILKAGLSLDSNMLPKSHAVGGSSDFEIIYEDHVLMIEVTLTDNTNQRRAEMESVSRHLGNILLSIEENKREKSYGIFMAPHLDRNVLNDFRARRATYWENSSGYIKGMDILPIDTDDLIEILKSNKKYDELRTNFYKLLAKSDNWGSKWYLNEVKPFIANLS